VGDVTNGNEKAPAGPFLVCECWIGLRQGSAVQNVVANRVLGRLLFQANRLINHAKFV
jgi:hypothetical protein